MVNGVILLAKQHRQGQDQAGHPAQADGDDLLPADIVIAVDLGKPVDDDPDQQQSGQDLQKNALRFLCFRILFSKKRTINDKEKVINK